MDERRLIDRILSVRYTDLEEEKQLCRMLLERSAQENNTYENAFAHVYMFDSMLALGDYSECDFFLSQGTHLCRENGYDELLMVLCNLAGLYYLQLNDEQTALEYYLEGMFIADSLKDVDTYAKLNNNMGLGFAGRDDWDTAKSFFEKAYKAVKKTDSDLTVSYMCNYAEASIAMGQLEGIEDNLKHCSRLAGDSFYYQIRLGYEWCSYYAKKGDGEKCIAKAQEMLDLEIEKYDNRYFVCNMMESFIESLTLVNGCGLAGEFLRRLEDLLEDAPLIVRYRTLCCKIKYLERCDIQKGLKEAYHDYYELELEMRAADDKVKSQSIQSRIQLNIALHEREEMKKEALKLENASHIDELTGLYNRRYFNKMVSKALQNEQTTHMGIIMIDMDYFKQYNDFYGHFMGDKALQAVADVLESHADEHIAASRYGGDEFVSLCWNLPDEHVDQYVNDIYTAMETRSIPHEKSKCCNRITLSIGYCSGQIGEKTAEQMIQCADEALYKAKEAGRNCYRRKAWNV